MDDAEPLFRFGEKLLSESSYFLRSPGERARSVDEMYAVIERFYETPHYSAAQCLEGQYGGW